MILQLLQLLFISLGFHNANEPKHSLYPQPKPLNLPMDPVQLVIIMVVGMLLFTLFIFLFMPGTESGLVYNQGLY